MHEQLEPEIEYTFPKTKWGKQYYAELIGKERLITPRKKKKVDQEKRTKGKAKRTAKRA